MFVAKKPLAVVTACKTASGTPTFAVNTVTVSQDEIDNGIHYYLAEAQLMIDGYEEPYVHFDQNEAPPFLHPAVRQHLASMPIVVNARTRALVEAN